MATTTTTRRKYLVFRLRAQGDRTRVSLDYDRYSTAINDGIGVHLIVTGDARLPDKASIRQAMKGRVYQDFTVSARKPSKLKPLREVFIYPSDWPSPLDRH